ncbi:hypothetical protein OVA14_08610 [Agrococcus sp. SL85]|uniref:hypothetical protein n=1 Tax=Agrococcus sp. SL85 TaxID=2995141 RepID=UPI00226C915B|nr:hypothetical protein [Agrococcus sp. SL85]WAC65429.1 hypothetical protein OVA14_08610 [Agrococcus sp. SL85]
MDLSDDLAPFVATTVPIFFVVLAFGRAQARSDVGRPHRWARAVWVVYLVALSTMFALLLWSVGLIASDGTLEGGGGTAYFVLLGLGVVLIYFAMIAKLDDLRELADRLKQEAAEATMPSALSDGGHVRFGRVLGRAARMLSR